MSSVAVLVGRGAEHQLALQVLCDGVPMRGLSLADPTTDTTNVRFLAPGRGGRVTIRLHNGGVGKGGAFVQLERAVLEPGESWYECRNKVVNKENILLLGESMTVLRDEGAGGRSFLVQPLRDAQGRVVRAEDAERRGLKRTKWRLGVWARYGVEQQLVDSTWRLMDSDHTGAPLEGMTPARQATWAETLADSKDWRTNYHDVFTVCNDNKEDVKGLRPVDAGTADAAAAQPNAAPAQDASSQPAAGSIAFGAVVPTPRTLHCHFTVHLKRSSPQLQFEVYVDEDDAQATSDLEDEKPFQLKKRLKTEEM